MRDRQMGKSSEPSYSSASDVLETLKRLEENSGASILPDNIDVLITEDAKKAAELVSYGVDRAIERILIDRMGYCPKDEWEAKSDSTKQKVVETVHFMLLGVSQEKLRSQLESKFSGGGNGN